MSELIISQRVLNIPEGKQISLTDIPKREQPNYYRVGNGTMNKYGIQSINLLTEVMKMSKAEQYLIRVIQDGFYYDTTIGHYTFITHLRPSNHTSTEQQYITKGYKLLSQKDLVRRVSRGHYMINPNALVPNRYDDAMQVWDDADPNKS